MLSKQVEIRGSIRYSIQYRIRITEPELSLDNRTQSPDLNQKESQHESRAEISSKITYWRRISLWTISSNLHHLPDQLGTCLTSHGGPESVCCVRVHWDEHTRIFQSNFQVRQQVTKFNFVSNIRRHWKTRLIRSITEQVQVQVQVFGKPNKLVCFEKPIAVRGTTAI
jgi:hypothetical protein